MKIGLVCSKCVAEANSGSGAKPSKIFVDVQDVGVYDLKCPQGHLTRVVLQDLKHELLFESGAIALIDGYAREAVASFAASVERFNEFLICVLAKAAKIDASEAWKQMSSNTERQLGAAIFLYLTINGKPLPRCDEKREFRNRVIHKGYFPTADEATDYGDYCLKYIFDTLNGLGQPCRDAVSEIFKDHVRKTQAKASNRVSAHHLRQPLIQTHALGQDYFGKYTLRQWINSVVEHVRPVGGSTPGASI